MTVGGETFAHHHRQTIAPPVEGRRRHARKRGDVQRRLLGRSPGWRCWPCRKLVRGDSAHATAGAVLAWALPRWPDATRFWNTTARRSSVRCGEVKIVGCGSRVGPLRNSRRRTRWLQSSKSCGPGSRYGMA